MIETFSDAPSDRSPDAYIFAAPPIRVGDLPAPSWERIAKPMVFGRVDITPRLIQALAAEFVARPEPRWMSLSSHVPFLASKGTTDGDILVSRDVTQIGLTQTVEMRGEDLFALVHWVPGKPRPPFGLSIAFLLKPPRLLAIFPWTEPE